MRLRYQLISANLLLVLAVLITTGSLFYFLRKRGFEQEEILAQEATFTYLASSCEEALLDRNDLAILNYFRFLLKRPALSHALLTDLNGSVLLHSDLIKGEKAWSSRKLEDPFTRRTLEAQSIRREERVENDRHLVEWYAPLKPGGRKTAILRLAYDAQKLEASRRKALAQSLRRFMQASLPCFGMGLIGAWVLSSFFQRRFGRIMKGALNYAQGDLSHVIELKGTDELGKLSDALNTMASRLLELDKLKRQFFHDLTHDMRAPLGAVSGYAQFLLSGQAGPMPQEQKEHLEQVREGARVLSEFTDNILDLARMERAEFVLKKKVLNLKQLGENVLALFSAQAKMLGITLKSQLPDNLPQVYGDETQLRRVFSNLVANALKFTPDGGKIVLEATDAALDPQGGARVTVSVQDTGCGIPKDKLGLIFTKFYKVPESGAYLRGVPGMGLGLAICKAIVEAHSGKIWVESESGKGCKFLLTLPMQSAQQLS